MNLSSRIEKGAIHIQSSAGRQGYLRVIISAGKRKMMTQFNTRHSYSVEVIRINSLLTTYADNSSEITDSGCL